MESKKGMESYLLWLILGLAGFLVALLIIWSVFPAVANKVIAGLKGI
ncbi:hypothetical protein HY638_00250 [Candidatus Woesearchaeota archaeon]|nr:hypothetical protein [Candidatus Woesearchaeota archaeon]